VPFASNDRRLDGFILPEVDNSIGLSVCKLETTLDDQSLRSLLTTCLVRSLGLTGTSRLHASVLGGAPGPAVATYDESMLQMLYCKALSVGSDKNRALRLLIEPNDCFRHSDGFTLHISNP
jgi:hypothetical protein